ncbi:hypothetical protein [Bacillus cereus]|uniref:hypothetical protein n=1 Tax=Bacillus cereus TaxID=1396 RepID=UPI000B4B397A|nr:hypothetical protein [Bacillus cereus]
MCAWNKKDFYISNNGVQELDQKKLLQFLMEAVQESGLGRWVSNNDIKVEVEEGVYRYSFKGLFKIRYFTKKDEFDFLYFTELNFFDVIGSSKEYPSLVASLENVLLKLNTILELQRYKNCENELEKFVWISSLYIRLAKEYDQLIFDVRKNTFYVGEDGLIIVIKDASEEGRNTVKFKGIQMEIRLKKLNEKFKNKVDGLISHNDFKDKLNARILSSTFRTADEFKNDLSMLFNAKTGHQYIKDVDNILQYLERDLSDSLFSIIYTMAEKTLVINNSYIRFDVKYYKYDSGYFLIDRDNNRIIYKTTVEGILSHCLKVVECTEFKVTTI